MERLDGRTEAQKNFAKTRKNKLKKKRRLRAQTAPLSLIFIGRVAKDNAFSFSCRVTVVLESPIAWRLQRLDPQHQVFFGGRKALSECCEIDPFQGDLRG